MIQDVYPGSGFLLFYPFQIPDPEVKKAPDPGPRIRIRNTGFYGSNRRSLLSEFKLWLFNIFETFFAINVNFCVAANRISINSV
jgi:hypothetical protein